MILLFFMFFTSWPSKIQALILTLTTVVTANGGPGRAQILLCSTPDIVQYLLMEKSKQCIKTVSIVSAKLGYTPLKDSNCMHISYPCICIHAGSRSYAAVRPEGITYAPKSLHYSFPNFPKNHFIMLNVVLFMLLIVSLFCF